MDAIAGTETDARRRAVAFMRAIEDACAERVVACPGGSVLIDSRRPRLWDANRLRVEAPRPPAADVLAAVAEQHFGGLAFRMITVDDERVGSALSDPLHERGYRAAHDLLMVHGGELENGSARRDGRRARVSEVTPADIAPTRVLAADELQGDAEAGRQLASRDALIAGAVCARSFAVLAGGEVAARCQLYLGDAVAQVENVYTLPAHRGCGYAAAVVSHAIEQAVRADAQLVFLIASADDWPQQLYRRLGFADAGVMHRFRRVGRR